MQMTENYPLGKIEALVDWADIRIATSKSSNFHSVQRAFDEALGLPVGLHTYVRPIEPNEGGGTCNFIVRVQDIARHAEIENLLSCVRAKLPLTPGFSIVGLEIALDIYCEDPAAGVASLYKYMTRPASDNRRMYRDFEGSVLTVPNSNSAARHVANGWMIGVGNKNDDWYQRFYFKKTDGVEIVGWETNPCTGKPEPIKEAKQLPPNEWRARMENVFLGKKLLEVLNCQTNEDWAHCKFERLAPYFYQREKRNNLDPLMDKIAAAVDQIGERRTRNRREGGTRQYSKLGKASPLNEAIRQALKNLSNRWKSTGQKGRPVNVAKQSACGNSGRINALTPHDCEEPTINSNNYISTNNNNYISTNNNNTQQPNNNDLNHPIKTRQQHHITLSQCNLSAESAEPIRPDILQAALCELMATKIELYETRVERRIKETKAMLNEIRKG